MNLSSFLHTKYPGGIIIAFLASLWILVFLPLSSQANEKKVTNPLGMTFILVEPGSFMMGSPKTEPFRDSTEILHSKKIEKPYYLQTTEVTLKQWRSLMGEKWLMKRSEIDDMPVTRVSFYDCLKFIRKLNKKKTGVYRLPTEAEWEYACRAGTTTAYSWGDAIDCSRAMYGNNAKKSKDCILFYKSMNIPTNGPAPVKTFAPNPWGFYDMHGNVWEWCIDQYIDYLTHTGNDRYSSMESEPRIRRSGSWFKHGQSLRSANRAYAHPGAKFITTGFRLVRELD